MDNDTRVALLALKAILEHEQSYRGTVLYDHNVFTFAKVALEKTGYINRDVPAVETSTSPSRFCGAKDIGAICKLPVGHAGEHKWTLTSERP